jgi:peptidoglycan/LPS O-acetylase OafA/YrhL
LADAIDVAQPLGASPIGEQPALDLEPSGARLHRFECFDGLRAVAALSVLLLHTAWISGFTQRSSLGAYTSRLEIGVAVFFLISGFLLYRPFAVSHLDDRPGPDARRFWRRRLLRIVPAYWLALTVLAYGFHVVSMGQGWQGFAVHYLFLQIYVPTGIVTGITQAWTLCTEVAFYLFLPCYAWLLGRDRARRSQTHQLANELVGVAILYAVSVAFRDWALHLPVLTVRNGKFVALCGDHCLTRPTYATLLPTWLPSYFDMFALGMLLAVVSAWFVQRRSEPRWLKSRFVPWVCWAGAALTFVLVSHVVPDHSILDFTTVRVALERQALYGVFAFLLLVPAVFGPQDQTVIRRLLRSWPLASLGVISYGIYLWHLDLAHQLLKWTGWNPGKEPFWVLTGPVLALAVVFATASYFALERPILRRKNLLGRQTRSQRRTSPPASRWIDETPDRPQRLQV